MGSFDRRAFLRTTAIALAATQLGLPNLALAQSSDTSTPNNRKGTFMTANSTSQPTPDGFGSVSQAPNLPDGFTNTFTSHYVDTSALRQHAVIGGDGPPLLLVHGWPQTWYAWRLVMPALARHFQVIAVDQRGTGLSDRTPDGYDTGTMASD